MRDRIGACGLLSVPECDIAVIDGNSGEAIPHVYLQTPADFACMNFSKRDKTESDSDILRGLP